MEIINGKVKEEEGGERRHNGEGRQQLVQNTRMFPS
jgi:hypothetical protein